PVNSGLHGGHFELRPGVLGCEARSGREEQRDLLSNHPGKMTPSGAAALTSLRKRACSAAADSLKSTSTSASSAFENAGSTLNARTFAPALRYCFKSTGTPLPSGSRSA